MQSGPKLIDVRVWMPSEQFDRRRTHIGEPADSCARRPSLPAEAGRDTRRPSPASRRSRARTSSAWSRSPGESAAAISARRLRDVQQVLEQPGMLPPGVRYTLGGLYEQQQIAFKGLLAVIVAAVALVFLLLLFLYESFRVALAIMLTTARCDRGGLHRPVADRHRTEHLVDDGHGDDRRQRDRGGDLLLLRISRTFLREGRRSTIALIAAGRHPHAARSR